MAKGNRDGEYEYKQVLIPNRGTRAQERALNKAGVDGWELVQTKTGGGWTKNTATFRRRKEPKRSRFTPPPASGPAAKATTTAPITYEQKQIQVPTASKADEERILAGWAAEGWEVTSKNPAGSGPDRTVRLRRVIPVYHPAASTARGPKTKEQVKAEWIGAGVLVVGTIVIFALLNSCGGDDNTGSHPAYEETIAKSTPTAAPTSTTEPAVAPTEPVEDATQPADTTASGMTAGRAKVACERYAESAYPYGFDPHWILGLIASRAEGDAWFLKADVDVTNEFGAERSTVVECTVSGTDSAPNIDQFEVYE